MRLATLIVASAAVLALAGCKKPAEDHAEEPGEVVAAGAVSDPAAATVTMDQAAADAKAAAEAVQSSPSQAEAPVDGAPPPATADAAPAPTPPAPPARPLIFR